MIEQLLFRTNTRGNPNNDIKSSKFFLGGGVLRQVWYVENTIHDEAVALKTMSYEREWTANFIAKQRIDAIVSERLTSSPYVVNIYGYCGDAAFYELANGGSLEDAVGDDVVNNEWTLQDKYNVALQMAHAVADLHDIDKDGNPVVVHDDLDLSQFVSVDLGTIDFLT